MTIAVIQFGGSNCDRDSVQALESLGVDADLVWHEDGLPEDVEGVVLPGGFSYGDYLRAGAMAARSPIMAEIREAASEGTPVLGICNGAQIGCESSLTPGAFTTNESARFQCEHVHLRVENADTPWTSQYEDGEVVELPIAHGEGRYEITDERLDELEAEDRILFKYCDEDGTVTPEANPNGSKHSVAGVTGEAEHVAVMMPHPERATLSDLGRTDGRGVLTGFAD
ncbi:phosphoribosylformylglycinamidine synthase I [Haloarcula sp. AONF1]